jgi:signal transduction histidine kinase
MALGGQPLLSAEILIVDDVAANLVALEAVLAPLARPIVRADSGEAALMQLLTRQFAVIILDVQMRGLDGFQTASLIRQRARTRETPIVFVTAFDEEFRQARRAYDLGAFDYITKPFDEEILRTKVAGFVRLYEQAAELMLAHEASRIRDVCMAVLGHDLRNPLNAVQMAAAMMARADDLPDQHRRNVTRIVEAAQRMEHLVGAILDFTRGELGDGIPIRREQISLASAARQILDEARLAHPERAFELAIDGECDGQWDPTRMGQLISNVVGNAIEHGEDGPIRCHIRGDAQLVRIEISNAGTIRAEVRQKLFEPFRRGDSSSSGLGLGLYIAKQIVRAHGGTIDVSSDEAQRETTFRASLPR